MYRSNKHISFSYESQNMFYLIKYSYNSETVYTYCSIEKAIIHAHQCTGSSFSGCQIEDASGDVYYAITRDFIVCDYR